jgi:hypothetical protein
MYRWIVGAARAARSSAAIEAIGSIRATLRARISPTV